MEVPTLHFDTFLADDELVPYSCSCNIQFKDFLSTFLLFFLVQPNYRALLSIRFSLKCYESLQVLSKFVFC